MEWNHQSRLQADIRIWVTRLGRRNFSFIPVPLRGTLTWTLACVHTVSNPLGFFKLASR